MKATNQYGSNAEKLDEQGLSNSGYSETTQAMMFNTYQNRVGTAKEALTKANVQYDNQIQQALLTNDANLAQLALETMQQTYQLALQGFQYKSTMAKEKIDYTQALDTIYQIENKTYQVELIIIEKILQVLNNIKKKWLKDKDNLIKKWHIKNKKIANKHIVIQIVEVIIAILLMILLEIVKQL